MKKRYFRKGRFIKVESDHRPNRDEKKAIKNVLKGNLDSYETVEFPVQL